MGKCLREREGERGRERERGVVGRWRGVDGRETETAREGGRSGGGKRTKKRYIQSDRDRQASRERQRDLISLFLDFNVPSCH